MLEKNQIVCKEALRDGRYIGWYSIYENGEVFEELPDELVNETPNGFYDINKDRLKIFGLYGLGIRLSFDVRDGVLKIQSKGAQAAIRFRLEQNDTNDRIKLVDRDDVLYNDIIQYKGFVATIDKLYKKEDMGLPPVVTTTDMYIGYKYNTTIPGKGTISFKFIANIDISKEAVHLQFDITPNDFSWDGDFIVNLNEEEIKRIPTSLVSGQKKTFEVSL